MKGQKFICWAVAIGLFGATAGGLHWLRLHQRLGAPGIRTRPIAGSARLMIDAPTQVLDYSCEVLPVDPAVISAVPQDTSLTQVRYKTSAGDRHAILTVVLMGSDRTSIHKPQFCLRAQGWRIDGNESVESKIPMREPYPYDLPVMKLLLTRNVMMNGSPQRLRGIYVYWFVADNDLTASHWAWLWRMGKKLMRTGELERWAYITCFTECLPGQEETAYRSLEEFIRAAVPQFQLAAGPRKSTDMAPVALR
jgi:hypothetical protein